MLKRHSLTSEINHFLKIHPQNAAIIIPVFRSIAPRSHLDRAQLSNASAHSEGSTVRTLSTNVGGKETFEWPGSPVRGIADIEVEHRDQWSAYSLIRVQCKEREIQISFREVVQQFGLNCKINTRPCSLYSMLHTIHGHKCMCIKVFI